MPKVLAPEQIEHYRREGYIHPLRCLDAAYRRYKEGSVRQEAVAEHHP